MSDAEGAGRPPRTVAFMNQKGGVGKTTTAVNLAAAVAEADQRVCLVDLDPQAHVMLHLGLDADDRPTIYDLLMDDQLDARSCIRTGARPGLDVIPAETDLAAAEMELAAVPERQRLLGRRLAGVLDRYDFVFIDCPPSLGLLTINALSMADDVLVPMQAHFLALQGVGKLLETVTLISREVNPRLRVAGIVLCMHERQTTLAREVVADLEDFLDSSRAEPVPWRDCRVLRPFVRRNVKVAEAPSYGQTVFDYAPWCAGANDYRRLAEQVIGRPITQATPAPNGTPPASDPPSARAAGTADDAAPPAPPEPPEPPVAPVTPGTPPTGQDLRDTDDTPDGPPVKASPSASTVEPKPAPDPVSPPPPPLAATTHDRDA